MAWARARLGVLYPEPDAIVSDGDVEFIIAVGNVDDHRTGVGMVNDVSKCLSADVVRRIFGIWIQAARQTFHF